MMHLILQSLADNDPFLKGYEAGMSGSSDCPHPVWSLDWYRWHAGHYAGNQLLCAQLEHICSRDFG